MTYTDDDVKRLVNEVESLLPFIKSGDIVGKMPSKTFRLTHCERGLETALKPFLPDPEEELLTSMCIAFDGIWNNGSSAWGQETEGYRATRIKCMAAALDVVKKKGLPE